MHNDLQQYRYELLQTAIEFFTQRFHIDQILDYAFQFTNDLLLLSDSALFVKQDNQFVLRQATEGGNYPTTIDNSEKLEQLPLFYGRIVTNDLIGSYIARDVVDQYSIDFFVPLINDTELKAIIVAKGMRTGPIKDEDLVISDILMRLINTSLENNQRFLDYQKINDQLDRKIFDLFVMNQSTRALLAELNRQNLYTIATDVFSEISGSAVTSFGIYDKLTNKVKMAGYRNVFSFETQYIELLLKEKEYKSSKIVLHMEEDRELLREIFVNADDLRHVHAQYVIIIARPEIIGVVAIGVSRQGTPYDPALFELIETLASTTSIAIVNTDLFEQMVKQKKEIEAKFHKLVTFNRLIKTITSCQTKEELFRLTMQMLQLGFQVKKAFIAVKADDGQLVITERFGFETNLTTFVIHDEYKERVTEKTYYSPYASERYDIIDNQDLLFDIGDSNAIVIAPIKLYNEVELTKGESLYGYLVVLEMNDGLRDDEVMLLDTVATSIAPVVFQMEETAKIQSQYKLDVKQQFVTAVHEKMKEREQYDLPFFVYVKRVATSFFCGGNCRRCWICLRSNGATICRSSIRVCP